MLVIVAFTLVFVLGLVFGLEQKLFGKRESDRSLKRENERLRRRLAHADASRRMMTDYRSLVLEQEIERLQRRIGIKDQIIAGLLRTPRPRLGRQ